MSSKMAMCSIFCLMCNSSKIAQLALQNKKPLHFELTPKSWTPNPTKKGQLHEQTQHTVQAKSSY